MIVQRAISYFCCAYGCVLICLTAIPGAIAFYSYELEYDYSSPDEDTFKNENMALFSLYAISTAVAIVNVVLTLRYFAGLSEVRKRLGLLAFFLNVAVGITLLLWYIII